MSNKTTIKKTVIKKTVKKPAVKKTVKKAAVKTDSGRIKHLTSFEQKILASNLGERLRKERLEVKVAEKSLKSAQTKAISAETALNDAKETSLTLREEFMKLQNELKLAKIDADESSTEARRREIELIEQTVRTQAVVSKRLEEEYQNTIKQIEEVEEKALAARNESEETYNKISEEVLSDVEIDMKTKIEDELDEMGERTRVVDLMRDGIDNGESFDDELEYMRLKNNEAIVNTQVAKEEAEFLKDADEVSKTSFARGKMGLSEGNNNFKLIVSIFLILVIVTFTVIFTLFMTGVL